MEKVVLVLCFDEIHVVDDGEMLIMLIDLQEIIWRHVNKTSRSVIIIFFF